MESYRGEQKSAVQASIDAFAEKHPDAKGYLVTFDTSVDIRLNNVDIKNMKVTDEHVQPRGCTALYDGIMRVLDIAKDDEAAHVVIFTDGMENNSKSTAKDVKEAISSSIANISWLAAGEAQIDAALELGMSQENVLDVGGSSEEMRTSMRIASAEKSSSGFTQMQRSQSSSYGNNASPTSVGNHETQPVPKRLRRE